MKTIGGLVAAASGTCGAALVVDGANAYGAMEADVKALSWHVSELRLEQIETGVFEES